MCIEMKNCEKKKKTGKGSTGAEIVGVCKSEKGITKPNKTHKRKIKQPIISQISALFNLFSGIFGEDGSQKGQSLQTSKSVLKY